MNKQQERAAYGPGWGEVLLGVTLSLILGVLCAAIYLVFKPVVIAKEPSEAIFQDAIYYLPGTTNVAAGRTWMRKKQVLVEGHAGDLLLSEEELNAWATATMKPAENSTDTIVPAQINFRINENILQIAAPTTFKVLGYDVPVVIQARGNFERVGEHYVFQPTELLLGSLATHRIPGATPKVAQYLLQVQPFPADVTEGLKRASHAVVEGDQLRLTFP
ncbi:MAG TPA: hypothetical protein PLN52_21685 [Opitutaceae bacterium]|nr:hypothetical protein [Opitutaceae bacterium]